LQKVSAKCLRQIESKLELLRKFNRKVYFTPVAPLDVEIDLRVGPVLDGATVNLLPPTASVACFFI
jgi:hypothetical protein